VKKIEYLRISVTDRCNFQCKYCTSDKDYRFIPHSEILRYEEICELVRVFKTIGIKAVRITGGEPLVRKGIENLIYQLKEIGIEDVSLTTNGYFLAEKSETLKEAGLNRVNVSLDSLKPEKFSYITGKDKESFHKVLEGIERAIKVGLNPVKINVVLIKDFNDDEIGDFISFSENYGVEVRFIELMPVGNSPFSHSHFIPISHLKNLIEKNWGKLIPTKTFKKGPAKSYIVENTKAVLGFIPSVSEHFCSECNRLRLTPEGKLRLCLMRDEEVDLKCIIRSSDYSPEKLKEVIVNAIERKKQINGIDALESLGCQRKMFTIGG
jgi:cyclic pyranopterin phosphate synthase